MRYFRLYLNCLRFSFSQAMEFRLDFFFRIVMDFVYFGIQIAFLKTLFLNTSVLGGWNEDQAILFIGGYMMVDALAMSVFSNNLWIFPELINRGDLDYYLVRPVSTLFFISLRSFAANSFVNLLGAIGIVIWVIVDYSGPVSFLQVILFFTFILNGAFIRYLLRMLLTLPTFWAQQGDAFRSLSYTLLRFSDKPDGIYSGLTRKILTTVFPVALIASFPARLIVEPLDFGVALQIAVVTALLFIVVLILWNKGLKSYASASS